MITDIHTADLKKRFDKSPLKNLSAIAIDEFYAGRKTKHYVFVLDLKSGTVVYVDKDKDAEAREGFWERLRPYKDNKKGDKFVNALECNLLFLLYNSRIKI